MIRSYMKFWIFSHALLESFLRNRSHGYKIKNPRIRFMYSISYFWSMVDYNPLSQTKLTPITRILNKVPVWLSQLLCPSRLKVCLETQLLTVVTFSFPIMSLCFGLSSLIFRLKYLFPKKVQIPICQRCNKQGNIGNDFKYQTITYPAFNNSSCFRI